jgi:secreted trypsin-like serine protease
MIIESDSSEFFPIAIPNERKMVHCFLANPYFSFTALQLSNGKNQEISADKKTWKTTVELQSIPQTKINSFAPGSDTAHIYVALFAHDDDVAYLLRTETTVHQLIKENKVPLTIDISAFKKQVYRYKWGIGSSVPGMPSMNSVSYQLEF